MRPEIRAQVESARQTNQGVVIDYVSATDPLLHAFLLYPKRIYERGDRAYVEGWSAFRPTRIRLFRRPFQPSGQVRRFRLDRIVDVRPVPPRARSLFGFIYGKIRRRGIVPGIWGLFLDLVAIVFWATLALVLLSKLWPWFR